MRLRGFTVEEAMEQTLEQIITPESRLERLGLPQNERGRSDCSGHDYGPRDQLNR
jgi:hypothetical protein